MTSTLLPQILAPVTVQIGDITMNETDDGGVLVGLTGDKWAGWGSPASTLAPQQKSRDHGGYAATAYLVPRDVKLGGLIVADISQCLTDPESLVMDRFDRLCAALALDAAQMTVTEDSLTRWAMVQRKGEVTQQWVTDYALLWDAEVVALDPRKYGTTIVGGPTGLPSSVGGLTWPVTWPIEWDGVTSSGLVHIDNPGDLAAPVQIRIDGPVTGPSIRHVASGKDLVLSSSYTLAAGSWLDIDTGLKTVLEGGTASRAGWITKRGWFMLDPGPNDFIFSCSGVVNPTAQMTVTATPAWL